MSALKNFGVVFVLCLVIFGLIASAVAKLITSTVDDILSSEKDELVEILNAQAKPGDNGEITDAPPISGDSFTSLFVVTDYQSEFFTYYPEGEELEKLRKDLKSRELGVLSKGYKNVKAKYIVIVRTDKASREYTITPLASCTRVFTPSGYMFLSDVYSDFGEEYFVAKIKALTGINIDYYFFMNVSEAPDIISKVGEFNVELASDIYSDGAVYGGVNSTTDTSTDTEEKKTPPTPKKDTDTEKKAESDKKNTHKYGLCVRAGNVTVGESNIKALLLFENFEKGNEERCTLEYQIAKGFLTRLASLPASERSELFSKICLYTNYDEFGRERYGDNMINTDMDEGTFQKKAELLSAYLNFTVTKLDFPGRFASGFFAPDLSEGVSSFFKYKLPPDPQK